MKQKKIQAIGTLVFDYLFLTILFNIATLLVLPLIPFIIGVQKYIQAEPEDRSLILVFVNIKENLSITLKMTLLLIIMFSFSTANIMLLDTGNLVLDGIVKGLSYVVLMIAFILLMNSPVIITNMNVTFRQALHNSIILIFGRLLNFLIQIAILVLFVYLVLWNFVIYLLGIFLIINLVSRLSYMNYIKLKERLK
ncbi:MAG: hypothetical protein KKE16_02710 [Firmicutes bacterium]|nr:hypothetical protein [Bacillota bacterium]